MIVKSSRTFVSSSSFLTGPSLSCVGTTSWVATAGGVLCTGPTSEETRCIVAAVRGGDTPSSNGTRYYFQQPAPSLASQCSGKRTFNIIGYYGKIALCSNKVDGCGFLEPRFCILILIINCIPVSNDPAEYSRWLQAGGGFAPME